MKILVTGSSGMLGSVLCAELQARGHEVTGLDIREPELKPSVPVPVIFADICSNVAVKEAFKKAGPEIVVHTAAWTDVDGNERDPEKAREINIEGTANIARAAADDLVPLIFISTDFVFNGKKMSPYNEEDACDPLCVYGSAKYASEKIVFDLLDRAVVVRTSWLFGPGGKNFVDTVISGALEGRPLDVVDDQTGSPTYVKDLSGALAMLADMDIKEKEIYHVCNSGQCSWYEFAQAIKEMVPAMKNSSIAPVSSQVLDRPAVRPAFSVMDTSKIRGHAGIELRSWQEALKEYLDTRRV